MPKYLNSEQHRRGFILVGAVLLWGLWMLVNPDRININSGFGFDLLYGELAQDFFNRLQDNVNRFWAARSFPSLVVFCLLKLSFVDLTPENVITAFILVNTFSLAVAAWMWLKICEILRIQAMGFWLGAIGVFVNFFVLKELTYISVRTDAIAYAIGIGMFYCYLARKSLPLYGLTFIGSFTWPSAVYMGTLFLLFPRSDHPQLALQSTTRWPWRYALAAVPSIGAFIYMHALIPGENDYLNRGKPIESVGYLSAAIAVTYLLLSLAELLKDQRLIQWSAWRQYFSAKSFYGTILFLGVIEYLTIQIATAPGNDMTFGHNLYLRILTSILQPGVFWIAHVLYWGPLIILITFLWQPICKSARSYGMGLTLWLMLSITLALGSESRHLVNIIPILVAFLVQYIETKNWTIQKSWQALVVSLFLSKVWLKIGDVGGELREFPTQFYYMTLGPWISHEMYIAQGSIIVLLTCGIYHHWYKPLHIQSQTLREGKPDGQPTPLPAQGENLT
ncbi:MAG: hypothetical protein EA366_07310 [Spirulina sp. DLM2.Bin59]|nr:MAG: hypothetical protein EA366_07310 [Spirulina sp. DLM2.Bin59]